MPSFCRLSKLYQNIMIWPFNKRVERKGLIMVWDKTLNQAEVLKPPSAGRSLRPKLDFICEDNLPDFGRRGGPYFFGFSCFFMNSSMLELCLRISASSASKCVIVNCLFFFNEKTLIALAHRE